MTESGKSPLNLPMPVPSTSAPITPHALPADSLAAVRTEALRLCRQIEARLATCAAATTAMQALRKTQTWRISGNYKRLPPALHAAPTLSEAEQAMLAAWAILDRIAQFDPTAWEVRVPDAVLGLYPAELTRIMDAVENDTVDMSRDRWRKNLAIAAGRLLPVGAEFADVHSGIPRSMPWRLGAHGAVRALRCILLECGGFAPFFELHAHPDRLDDFTPHGWDASYRRLAALLDINPGYKGVMAASWFRDPALTTISPRLTYLREVPDEHGATMFHVASDREGRSGALARSATRRRLFDEGRYVPQIYMMIWPRKALLAFGSREAAAHD